MSSTPKFTFTGSQGPTSSLLLRLYPDSPFPQVLLEALSEIGGGNYLVLGGIGMLREFELGYFDGQTYHKQTFALPHELVSLQGTVVEQGPEGQPLAHLHAALAGHGFKTVSGHLFQGTVGVTLEVTLLPLSGPASRAMEPSGLALLQLKSRPDEAG